MQLGLVGVSLASHWVRISGRCLFPFRPPDLTRQTTVRCPSHGEEAHNLEDLANPSFKDVFEHPYTVFIGFHLEDVALFIYHRLGVRTSSFYEAESKEIPSSYKAVIHEPPLNNKSQFYIFVLGSHSGINLRRVGVVFSVLILYSHHRYTSTECGPCIRCFYLHRWSRCLSTPVLRLSTAHVNVLDLLLSLSLFAENITLKH